MKRNKSEQIHNKDRRQTFEAKSSNKLRKLMQENGNKKANFIEIHDEEYIAQNDQQDYNDLDKWKKDLLLKENDDMSDKLKQRFQHIQSLKEDIQMPELNFDVIDSVMNPKYYQDEEIVQNQEQTPSIICNYSLQNAIEKARKSVLLGQDFNVQDMKVNRSTFYAQAKNENFTDFINEQQDQISQSSKRKSVSKTLQTQPEQQSGSPKSPTPKVLEKQFSKINSQSSIFLQRNLNKQLLNNLLLNRITKKYVQNQKTEIKCEEIKNEVKKVRIDPNIQGQSFYQQEAKQKNESVDKIRFLFSEETDKFSKTTLNSFKNVGTQFFRLGNVIEYDQLLRDIISEIFHPQGILDEKKINSINGETEFDQESYNYLEKALLDNYTFCSQKIEELQTKIKEERLYQTNISQELKNTHEQMVSQLARIDLDEELFLNEINSSNNSQIFFHSMSTKMNTVRFKNVNNQDFRNKHKKIEEEREEVKIYFDTLKKAITQRTKTSLEKLELMDKEILKIKQKRNTTKLILKDLYLKAIKSNQFPKQSLVLIVKQLILINEELSNSNILPSFLDEDSKQFLIQWAKLMIEQDRIQEKIKRLNVDGVNVSQQYQSLAMESSKISSKNSREAIQQKVHRMAKSCNQQKQTDWGSMTQSSQNFYPGVDEVSQNSYVKYQERIAFDLNKFSDDCIQAVGIKNDLRQELHHVNVLIERIKESEKQRLYQKYKPNGFGYQQKIAQLQQSLNALFGKQECELYITHHLKQQSLYDEKINSQKFFKFSSKKVSQDQQQYQTSNSVGEDSYMQQKHQIQLPQKNVSQTAAVKWIEQQRKQSDIQSNQQQKLKIPQQIINNYMEKKDSINQNNKLIFQYSQLSNQLFSHSTKHTQKHNLDHQQLLNQPGLLDNYFFNINLNKRRASDHNSGNNSQHSLLKSPQFSQSNSQNVRLIDKNKKISTQF
ncbi:hypothetical protein TTHERM_00930870 (macronuclear) [Tetrahymena thermophila SB210]|uniref:Uncharacterized protein n=1 Tax=Tetrahymena thermophila (strain SB210) TaxID=312017 RepID=Q24CF4_TETTS|nr:hypothetical protein TTHERM_00930870 [Tetrahymena thermophila SB210]EAS05506.2 hypothetical protein TTHERM_00930870 [Tetrahymena thermophila SB210]|eukprot:XP_001025751.2 hypothetical protein TTHERM_00930870 [Tetrahymena thermophila SB210]